MKFGTHMWHVGIKSALFSFKKAKRQTSSQRCEDVCCL